MRRAPHILVLLALTGCEADNGLSFDRSEAPDDSGGYGAAPSADSGDATGTDDAPSEEEDDFLRLAPAATDAYVFIANATRGTVTRVSVPSLAALTAEVGELPSVVATASDYSFAVTLNEGTDDVSLIEAASMAVTHVGIRPNLNRLALSDDGAWALAWYDPSAESEDPADGLQSFNEVSLVALATGRHTPMAVGFNPHGVQWTTDGHRAIVVSDASLAVIDLTAESPSPTLVALTDDPVDAPAAEEVALSPDGSYAFVRQFGADELVIVDLTELTVDRVSVGTNPTDLDLSPDGATVAVVSRGAQEIWTFDAADPWADPDVVPLDSHFGSVVFADADTAILYTNATALAAYGVWDLATGVVTERSLVKPVASVQVSPTGTSVLISHTKTDADDADPDSVFSGAWALTLVDLDDFRSNPLALDAEPTGWATSDDGRWGYFIMDGLKYLEILDFDSLLYEEMALPSVPVHLGVLPGGNIAWASQEHDLGRISFYDPSDASLDTITGFELNSEIEHE